MASRTEKSIVYDNPDGTKTLKAHAVPIHFRDRRSGAWRPFDDTLVSDGGKELRQAAGPVPIRLAEQTGADIVTVGDEKEGWSIGFRLDGAASGRRARITDGKVARYDDVTEGVSLEYHTNGDSLKEQIVLSRPPAGNGPVVYRFPLALDGVTPEARDDGSIVFLRDGEPVASIPPGFATDATKDDPLPSTGRVINKLVKAGNRWRIDVTPDAAWLRDPARRYPVYIDPQLFLGRQSPGPAYASSDAFVGSGCGNCNFNGQPGPNPWQYGQIENNAYINKIGKSVFNGGNWEFYTYLYYDIAPIRNHQILWGSWEGYFYEASTYPSGGFAIRPVSQPWDSTAINWDNKPSPRPENVLGHMPGAGWQWIVRDLTAWVANWANNTWPYYGVRLDTLGLNHWLKMAAVEQRWQNQDSVLNVTFNNTPATPGALNTPSEGATVMTTSPTLSANASSDPEGDPLTYWHRISTSPDGTGYMVNSGPTGTTTWTPPANTLQDGQTYYWQVHTWDGWQWSQSAMRKFTVDLRLGHAPVSPHDSAGPVSVNLANGNVHFTVDSPKFQTVGGPLGLSYAYNSGGPSIQGLNGNYVRDCNPWDPNWPNWTNQKTTRRDPSIDFNWGGGSPMAGIDGDHFCIRWDGWITLPKAGHYCWLSTRDDGMNVWINNQLVLDSWYDQSTGSPDWGDTGYPCTDTTLDDQAMPITVDYYENTGGAFAQLWHSSALGYGPVPTSWLSTTPPVLPQGWTLSTGATQDLAYASAKVNSNSVTLTDTAGGTHEYRRNADGADGSVSFTPPPGEDDIMTMGQDGTYGSVVTVMGSDGLVYTFTATGKLVRAESIADGAAGTAPTYGYNTSTGRLDYIADPLSQRRITLKYSAAGNTYPAGECAGAPGPFQTWSPAGMLCQVDYWDGTSTSLYYLNDRLARIVDPGGEVTDFGYDGNGRVNRVRDPLGADKVATAPGALDNDTTRTVIGYDGHARASSVTLPQPNAGSSPAEPQPARNYGYFWTPNDVYGSGGTTDVHIAGLSEPNGYARRVVFDTAGRVVQDRDTAGLLTTTTWNGDRLVGRTDPAGLRVTSVFDQAERVVETWGPAPSSCFGAAPGEAGWRGERPTSCTVPVARTAYDEGINGLAATYWSNPSQTGRPTAWATGVGDPSGALAVQWGSGAPPGVSPTGDNWSSRFTGEIRFPSGGTYALKVCSDDGTRLFVNDQRLIDDWNGGAGCRGPVNVSASAAERKRIRVDHRENGGTASMTLFWTPPGGAEQVVPGANLFPRYGLTTSSTDADGKRTETQYAQPEYGFATASVQFPGGGQPALTSTTSYEPIGPGSYLRRTHKTLPKGAATAVSYAYYLATEPAPANECGVAGVVQAGMLKRTTSADPEGPDTAMQREYVYDSRGRVAGSRVVGDSRWTCTSYDARGRVVSSTNHAGRTTTVAYSTNDPGLTTTTAPDSDGVTRTTVGKTDLVGRDVSYTDELGTTTRRVYDQAGRNTEVWRKFSNDADTRILSNAYNSVGRLSSTTEHLSGAPRTTTYGYDTATGRPTTTARPNGVTSTMGYEASTGTVNSIAHGSLSTWSYQRSLGGRVTSETAGGSGTPARNRSFSYDGAGRLTRTDEGATTRNYAWDADTNRCARATACDGSHTFDSADRIMSSPDYSAYTYDYHGNMTSATPRTQPGPVPINDSFSFDATTSPPAARTYPIEVGQNGTVSASFDWTNTGTAVSTGSNSGSLGAAPASATTTAATGPWPHDTELKASMTWNKALHRPTEGRSLSVSGGTSQTTDITTNATGDIVSTMDWAPTSKSLSSSGSVANVPPSAPTVAEGTFTATGNGYINLDLTWPKPPTGITPDLRLELLDHVTGQILLVVDDTNAITDARERIPSPGWQVTGLGTYPSSRTYRWRVSANTGYSSSFTLNGSYPTTATMDFRLENTSGTTLANSTQVSGTARRNLTYANAPAGTYRLRAISSNEAATPSLSTTYSRLDWADVTLALKNGTTTLKTVSSSGGNLNTSYVVPHSSSSGTFNWVVTNNSSTLTVPAYTLNRTLTTLGADTATGSILPTATATKSITADAAGFADVSFTWAQATLGGYADLTVALKNGSTVIDQRREADGSISFANAVPGPGTYTVSIVNNSVAADVPSYTLNTRAPRAPAVAVDMVLKNAAGTTVATATGTQPRTLSTSAVPGTYTLVVTPTGGKANATLTGSHPAFPNRYDVTYDANDHAVRIDDGRTVVNETLSPSGRVLRRRVTEVATGSPVEDTVFGYATAGDNPSYARPFSGGTVTTYLGGVTYTGTTAAWHHANGHGDIVGTTDVTGTFTATPATDEFGAGMAPPSRLGWLGAHDRFSVGGRTPLVRMGIRLYDPSLGRFLAVDPIEGGSANSYDYCFGDPVNCKDLDGLAGFSMTKAEKRYCRAPWNWIVCAEARRMAKVAVEETIRRFGHNTDGTRANAFQHCYWQAMLANKYGRGSAKAIGDRHEQRARGKNESETAYRDNKAMDLKNNEDGRQIGHHYRRGDLANVCARSSNAVFLR